MLKKILHKPQAVLGLCMMLAIFLIVCLAPLFAPNNPDKVDVLHILAAKSPAYPLEQMRWGAACFPA